MTTPLPPGLVAAADQDQAALTHLVAQVHAHTTGGCQVPWLCPGGDALRTVLALDCPDRDRLLLLAAVQLATHPPSTKE